MVRKILDRLKARFRRTQPQAVKTYRSLEPGKLGMNRQGHVFYKNEDGSQIRVNKKLSKKARRRVHGTFMAEAKRRGVEVDADELNDELKSFKSKLQVKALMEYAAD